MEILRNIPLAPLTTLRLGGEAAYFANCKSENDLKSAIQFANENRLPYWILGGGSNTIVLDKGYTGLVIKNEIFGIQEISNTDTEIVIQVGAGENWDEFVLKTLELGLTGIECLSGIPGNVGASPIQNIGAYGQEVSETIESVRVMNSNLNLLEVTKTDCDFSYRNSRFKSGDWKKNIITFVTFRLSKKNPINLRYPEVVKNWRESNRENANRIEDLLALRKLILGLRQTKSMVLNPLDPNTKSVGSFFTNPFLSSEEKEHFMKIIKDYNLTTPQFYPEGNQHFKISAAWLIENSGFKKGFVKNGVGISTSHNLALININGTTKSLLELAEEIKKAVLKRFEINLSMEPVILN